ncbi:hypothetical protein [Actinoplanes sp. NPDC023714]|uniref:hypothetical protein n=1 Tax=Actinoplanes sp. NPDC023714 TaxID=3154322 RepID=UPI0033D06B19
MDVRFRPALAFRTSVAAMVAGGIVGASVAAPAQAAPNPHCDDTRAVSRDVAAEPDMVESTRTGVSRWDRADAEFEGEFADFGVDDYEADVVLRYSPSRQCAYALITLDDDWRSGYITKIYGPSAWMDTSQDGGATISLGTVNERVVPVGYSSTYTSAFSMTDIAIRACGRGVHTHTSFGAKSSLKGRVGPSIGTEIHNNDVVCTEWVTL